MVNFKREVVKGISWMGGLRVITRGLSLLKFVILARFLSPEQFGIYGVAILLLGLTEIVTETGINVFLIQRKESINEYIDTAWVISIARGIAIGILIFLLAPLIAALFSIPEAVTIIRLTAMVPFIKGFINPAEIKFQKDLDFNKEFYFRSTLFLVDAGIAIGLGILMQSELALILAMIVSAKLEVLVSLFVIKPQPRLKYEMKKVREIIKEGKWITFAGTFEYLFQHLDDILVGRLLGAYSLGLYQQAYRISTLPISESEQIISRVTLPVYANISGDRKQLRSSFLKITSAIALFVIPFGLLLMIFSREIILLLFGEIWLPAVPALRVLAVFGIIKALSNSGYPLFLSLKKQRVVTYVTTAGILGLSIPLVPLINQFGIVGAAYATILGSFASIIATIYFLFKTL